MLRPHRVCHDSFYQDAVQINISEIPPEIPSFIIKNCTGKCRSSLRVPCFSCKHQQENLALELLLNDKGLLSQRIINANIKNLIKCIEFFEFSVHSHHKSLANVLKKELDDIKFFNEAISKRNKLKEGFLQREDRTPCRPSRPSFVTKSCHKRFHESLASCSDEDEQSNKKMLKCEGKKRQLSYSSFTLNAHNDADDEESSLFKNLGEYCGSGAHIERKDSCYVENLRCDDLYEIPIIEFAENNEQALLEIKEIGEISTQNVTGTFEELSVPIQESQINCDSYDPFSFISQDEKEIGINCVEPFEGFASFSDDISIFDDFSDGQARKEQVASCKDFHDYLNKLKISQIAPSGIVENIEKALLISGLCLTNPSAILWFIEFLKASTIVQVSFDLKMLDEALFLLSLTFPVTRCNSLSFKALLPMGMLPCTTLPKIQLQMPYAYLNKSTIQQFFSCLSTSEYKLTSVLQKGRSDVRKRESSKAIVAIPTAMIMQDTLEKVKDLLNRKESQKLKKKLKKSRCASEGNLLALRSKGCVKRLADRKCTDCLTSKRRSKRCHRNASYDKCIGSNSLAKTPLDKKAVVILKDCLNEYPSLKEMLHSNKKFCSSINLKAAPSMKSASSLKSESKVITPSSTILKNEEMLCGKDLNKPFEEIPVSSWKAEDFVPKEEFEVKIEKAVSSSEKFHQPEDKHGCKHSYESPEILDNSDAISLDVGSGGEWDDVEEPSKKTPERKPRSASPVYSKSVDTKLKTSNSVKKDFPPAQKSANNVQSSISRSKEIADGCSLNWKSTFYPKPRIQNGFCFKYFYEGNCFKWNCSFSHNMPYESLKLFLGDLLLHYMSSDNSQKAWELLFSYKKHFESKNDYLFLASILKPLAKLVANGGGPTNFWVPMRFTNVFNLVKLEAYCEIGNVKEAFEILSEPLNYDKFLESIKEQRFFTFVRYCERLPECKTLTATPWEVVSKKNCHTFLPTTLVRKIKEELDYHYILFYLKNDLLDKAVCVYNLIVGKLSASENLQFKAITSTYISFMKNGGKQKEIANVWSHVKKFKRFDSSLLFEIFLSIKATNNRQVGVDFLETILKENLHFPFKQFCAIGEFSFELNCAFAMKVISFLAKKIGYQPRVAQLLKLLNSFDSDSEGMWTQLYSIICCLKQEAICELASPLQKLISSAPYFPVLDSIIHECCNKGANIEFTSMMTEGKSPFCKRPPAEKNTMSALERPSLHFNKDDDLHSSFEYTEEYTYVESSSDDPDSAMGRSSPRNSAAGEREKGRGQGQPQEGDMLAIQDDTITGHSHRDVSMESTLAPGSVIGSNSPLSKRSGSETLLKEIFTPDSWHGGEFDSHNALLSPPRPFSPPVLSTGNLSRGLELNSQASSFLSFSGGHSTAVERLAKPKGSFGSGVYSPTDGLMFGQSGFADSSHGLTFPGQEAFAVHKRPSNRSTSYRGSPSLSTQYSCTSKGNSTDSLFRNLSPSENSLKRKRAFETDNEGSHSASSPGVLRPNHWLPYLHNGKYLFILKELECCMQVKAENLRTQRIMKVLEAFTDTTLIKEAAMHFSSLLVTFKEMKVCNFENSSISSNLNDAIAQIGCSLLISFAEQNLFNQAAFLVVSLVDNGVQFHKCFPLQRDPASSPSVCITAIKMLYIAGKFAYIRRLIEEFCCSGGKRNTQERLRILKEIVSKLLQGKFPLAHKERVDTLISIMSCLVKSFNHDKNVLGERSYSQIIYLPDYLISSWELGASLAEGKFIKDFVPLIMSAINLSKDFILPAHIIYHPLVLQQKMNYPSNSEIAPAAPLSGFHPSRLLGPSASPCAKRSPYWPPVKKPF